MASTNVSYPGVVPPPPGQTADLANAERITLPIVLAASLCPVFALLFCMLRLYTARFIVRRIYADDCKPSRQRRPSFSFLSRRG